MHVKHQHGCGSFRNITEIVPLIECNENVEAHLRRNHLSERGLSESKLILIRAGNFDDVGDNELKEIFVCPKHRASLGKYFQSKTVCQYPGHTAKSKTKAKTTRVFNVQVSKEVLAISGLLIPVGSRKYISRRKQTVQTNSTRVRLIEQLFLPLLRLYQLFFLYSNL